MQFPDTVERWPIDRLRPYDRNARTHSDSQVAQIAASVIEFGFTNPILADGQGNIIAGHGRLAAAKQLGLDTVPVLVLDHLTEAQRRAYVLADNKLALNAGWDEELLAAELHALNGDGFDLGLTGFSDEELADLLAPLDDEPFSGSGSTIIAGQRTGRLVRAMELAPACDVAILRWQALFPEIPVTLADGRPFAAVAVERGVPHAG